MPDFFSLLPAAGGWAAALTVLMAAANCFLGFKLSKLWISLAGFLLGGALGGWLAGVLSLTGWWPLLPAVGLGALGAVLAYRVYRAGVFLLCFLAVFGGVSALIATPWLGALAGLAAGLAAGLLSVKLLRPALILSTGVGGGFSAGLGLVPLLGLSPLWGALAGVVLAVAGTAVQFRTTAAEDA